MAGTGLLAGGRRRRQPQTTTRPMPALKPPGQPTVTRLRLGPDPTGRLGYQWAPKLDGPRTTATCCAHVDATPRHHSAALPVRVAKLTVRSSANRPELTRP